MAKLIKLEEAAQFLGITPEKLTEMRSRNEIFGYRDGPTWKFKLEELERVARELGLEVAGEIKKQLDSGDYSIEKDFAAPIQNNRLDPSSIEILSLPLVESGIMSF